MTVVFHGPTVSHLRNCEGHSFFSRIHFTYNSLCLSVAWFVGPSVGRRVGGLISQWERKWLFLCILFFCIYVPVQQRAIDFAANLALLIIASLWQTFLLSNLAHCCFFLHFLSHDKNWRTECSLLDLLLHFFRRADFYSFHTTKKREKEWKFHKNETWNMHDIKEWDWKWRGESGSSHLFLFRCSYNVISQCTVGFMSFCEEENSSWGCKKWWWDVWKDSWEASIAGTPGGLGG